MQDCHFLPSRSSPNNLSSFLSTTHTAPNFTLPPCLLNLTLDLSLSLLNDTNSSRFYHPNDSSRSFIPLLSLPPWSARATGVVLMVLVTLLAFSGNLLVLVAILRSRRLRVQPTNHFVASLCAADLLAAVAVLPLSAASFALGDWGQGSGLCGAHRGLTLLVVCASCLSTGAISVERFYAIQAPMRHAANLTPAKARVVITLLWAAALLLASWPWLLRLVIQQADDVILWAERSPRCSLIGSVTSALPSGYVIVVTAVCYLTPCCVLAAVYWRIYKVAKRSGVNVHPAPRPARSRQSLAVPLPSPTPGSPQGDPGDCLPPRCAPSPIDARNSGGPGVAGGRVVMKIIQPPSPTNEECGAEDQMADDKHEVPYLLSHPLCSPSPFPPCPSPCSLMLDLTRPTSAHQSNASTFSLSSRMTTPFDSFSTNCGAQNWADSSPSSKIPSQSAQPTKDSNLTPNIGSDDSVDSGTGGEDCDVRFGCDVITITKELDWSELSGFQTTSDGTQSGTKQATQNDKQQSMLIKSVDPNDKCEFFCHHDHTAQSFSNIACQSPTDKSQHSQTNPHPNPTKAYDIGSDSAPPRPRPLLLARGRHVTQSQLSLKYSESNWKAAATLLFILSTFVLLWSPYFILHVYWASELSAELSDPSAELPSSQRSPKNSGKSMSGEFVNVAKQSVESSERPSADMIAEREGKETPDIPPLVELTVTWVAFASFATNALVYGWMNRAIRDELVRLKGDVRGAWKRGRERRGWGGRRRRGAGGAKVDCANSTKVSST